MDNDQGGPQAIAEEHEIELMQQLMPNMLNDIQASVQCLNEPVGGSTCNIFRVPEAVGEGIAKACQPRMVSIGPYHHGESQLEMFQVHKKKYLHDMLVRTEPHGICLERLIDVVAPKEENIRGCYSESTDNFNRPTFVEMMILDGCFIIEFLRRGGNVDGSLFDNVYVGYCVMKDLLRLENQVPYFVLEDLFGTTNVVPGETSSLADLIFKFFNGFVEGRGTVRERQLNLNGDHLLDAFRLSLIPWDQQDDRMDDSSSFSMIRSASELRRVGIGFKQREASTFLDIKFDRKRRIVGIPKIIVEDGHLNWILPNMIAFEQCCGRWNACHVTAYALFMGCLIHTVDDVQLLRDCKVISNHGMSNEGFARFFGDIRKATPTPIEAVKQSYLASQFAILNKSLKYERAYHCWAQLLNAFHDNPWSALSGLAVVVTLVGIIQTMYAVLQYYYPK